MTRCMSMMLILLALCAAGCGVSLDAKHDALLKGTTKAEGEAILGSDKLDKQISARVSSTIGRLPIDGSEGNGQLDENNYIHEESGRYYAGHQHVGRSG